MARRVTLEPVVSKLLVGLTDALAMMHRTLREANIRDQLNVDFLHSEFFLILPTLDRKVRERPEEATAAEKTIVTYARQLFPALLLSATTGDGASAAPPPPPPPAAAATNDQGTYFGTYYG